MKLTTTMKAALVGIADAADAGRVVYKAAGVNEHTMDALRKHGLVETAYAVVDGRSTAASTVTAAGAIAVESIRDEQWGIGGEWVPSADSLDTIVANDMRRA